MRSGPNFEGSAGSTVDWWESLPRKSFGFKKNKVKETKAQVSSVSLSSAQIGGASEDGEENCIAGELVAK